MMVTMMTTTMTMTTRSEEHTSELQSRENLVCRLLLERPRDPRVLPPFPPRRSSDLTPHVRADASTRAPQRTSSDDLHCGKHRLKHGRLANDGNAACGSLSCRHDGDYDDDDDDDDD